jgi:hypothetical protein
LATFTATVGYRLGKSAAADKKERCSISSTNEKLLCVVFHFISIEESPDRGAAADEDADVR